MIRVTINRPLPTDYRSTQEMIGRCVKYNALILSVQNMDCHSCMHENALYLSLVYVVYPIISRGSFGFTMG